MRTVRIGRLRIGVALRARDPLWRRLVHQALHIGVAIDARQRQRSVNGVLQLAFIHKQADRLAVHVLGERVVAMAGEAVLIFQFVLGLNGAGEKRQKDNKASK